MPNLVDLLQCADLVVSQQLDDPKGVDRRRAQLQRKLKLGCKPTFRVSRKAWLQLDGTSTASTWDLSSIQQTGAISMLPSMSQPKSKKCRGCRCPCEESAWLLSAAMLRLQAKWLSANMAASSVQGNASQDSSAVVGLQPILACGIQGVTIAYDLLPVMGSVFCYMHAHAAQPAGCAVNCHWCQYTGVPTVWQLSKDGRVNLGCSCPTCLHCHHIMMFELAQQSGQPVSVNT